MFRARCVLTVVGCLIAVGGPATLSYGSVFFESMGQSEITVDPGDLFYLDLYVEKGIESTTHGYAEVWFDATASVSNAFSVVSGFYEVPFSVSTPTPTPGLLSPTYACDVSLLQNYDYWLFTNPYRIGQLQLRVEPGTRGGQYTINPDEVYTQSSWNWPSLAHPQPGPGIIVNVTPEPVSLALLLPGCLLLRRRARSN